MSSVAELKQQIREIINNPRKQHALLQDAAAWNLLCSCLDTIGDTELAIDAYDASGSPDSEGAAYLVVYGALQALFVQQDAVENLCQALAIAYSRDPLLKDIREIRNDSAGHPTKRGGGKGQAYNFISRLSLTKGGFDLMTTYPDNRLPLFRHVSIPSLIAGQRGILRNVLTEVFEKLKKEELEHRAKYRDQRLQDVFPPTLGYDFQKIAEAVHGSKPADELGVVHIRFVAEAVEAFKEGLRERGILDAYDSIIDLLQQLEYAIRELSTYFAGPTRSCINAKGAYVFAFFIEKHIEKLKDIAKRLTKPTRVNRKHRLLANYGVVSRGGATKSGDNRVPGISIRGGAWGGQEAVFGWSSR